MHNEILFDKIELIEESIRIIEKRMETILEADDNVINHEIVYDICKIHLNKLKEPLLDLKGSP